LDKKDIVSETGIVVGTMLGNVYSNIDFIKDSLICGPRYVNPSKFPDTVTNSLANQVSIRFGMKKFSVTIATGCPASLDAIDYATNMLHLNRANTILVGGVEELCAPIFLGFHKLGFLAGKKKELAEVSAPFDKRRNGIILGEGACMLIIEELKVAQSRGAKIYAEVSGYGTSFNAYSLNTGHLAIIGAKSAMQTALNSAGLNPEDVDYVCSGANSRGIRDKFSRLKLLFRYKLGFPRGECKQY